MVTAPAGLGDALGDLSHLPRLACAGRAHAVIPTAPHSLVCVEHPDGGRACRRRAAARPRRGLAVARLCGGVPDARGWGDDLLQRVVFEIFYEILYEILFRTMGLPSARAREQIALSKFREHACLLCAMSEPHVHYRCWNRDMQLALCKACPSRGHGYLDFQ